MRFFFAVVFGVLLVGSLSHGQPMDDTTKINQLMDRGEYKAAVEALDSFIEKNRKYAAAYGLRAKALMALGKFGLAEKDLDRAIEISPKADDKKEVSSLERRLSALHFLRAMVHYQQDEAVAMFEDLVQSLKINPNNATAHLFTANILLDAGEWKGGLVHLGMILHTISEEEKQAYSEEVAEAYAITAELNFARSNLKNCIANATLALLADSKNVRARWWRYQSYTVLAFGEKDEKRKDELEQFRDKDRRYYATLKVKNITKFFQLPTPQNRHKPESFVVVRKATPFRIALREHFDQKFKTNQSDRPKFTPLGEGLFPMKKK